MSDRMGFSLRPQFEGEFTIERLPDDFMARMERRVAEGLLQPGQRHRANYGVRSSSRDALEFEAEDFLTAYNIGLNHVELVRTGPATVFYRVDFRRWSRFVTIHGALMGAAATLVLLVPAVRRDVRSYPQGLVIFWGMVLFWAVVWPRIMTALHRPFASKALERILRDELMRAPHGRAAA